MMGDLEIYIKILKEKDFVFAQDDINSSIMVYKYFSEDVEEYAYLYITYNKKYNYIVKLNLFQDKEIFNKEKFLKELEDEFEKIKND